MLFSSKASSLTHNFLSSSLIQSSKRINVALYNNKAKCSNLAYMAEIITNQSVSAFKQDGTRNDIRKAIVYKKIYGGTQMKNITEKLEKVFSAITFAEAGEVETARQIMEESATKEKPLKRADNKLHIPAAVTES